MEDRHALMTIPSQPDSNEQGGALIAVFDGHRGVDAAILASDLIPRSIVDRIVQAPQDLSPAEEPTALLKTILNQEVVDSIFYDVDGQLRRSWEDHSLRSSRANSEAASGEYLPSPSGGGLLCDLAVTSNPTSGQSSPQELNVSTLRAPPTLHGSSELSSITGTTAVVAVTLPQGYVFINVGDSRSYLVTRRCDDGRRSGEEDVAPSTDSATDDDVVRLPLGLQTKATSADHRTTVATEVERIEQSGGYVINGRVNGKLSVTRALGDFDLKPNLLDACNNPVICTPDIVYIPHQLKSIARQGTAQHLLQSNDSMNSSRTSEHAAVFEYDLIVVGCDGVWELQDINKMAMIVDERLQANVKELIGGSPTQIEHFPEAIEQILKDSISQILMKCCAPSCDPNGSSHGADNLSLGMLLMRQ